MKNKLILAALWVAFGCNRNTMYGDVGPGTTDGGVAEFRCTMAGDQACEGARHLRCVMGGEFISRADINCADTRSASGEPFTCVSGGINGSTNWCYLCRPGTRRCAPSRSRQTVEICNAAGTAWDFVEDCDVANGLACSAGTCRNLCMAAETDRSYAGCEFYGVDLDNASLSRTLDASAQQYAIVISNPNNSDTRVWIETDNTAFNGTSTPVRQIDILVPPHDVEVIRLGRREVDGSSSMEPCTSTTTCQFGEQCFCPSGQVATTPDAQDCFCRNRAGANGINDGTHSALSSRAYHVRAELPVIAYQFNPLDNVGVFSNDASMLLPVTAMGTKYTVISWPQTIANSTNPDEDFDPSSTDEDLRAFLTVVGTAEATNLTIRLGAQVRQVVGIEGFTNPRPGDTLTFTLGRFDVVNLETQGFNADFTGTVVEASSSVAVFTGSEASDAPRFDTISNRQCCGDHVEEQLIPDSALGLHFFVGRTPSRTRALNNAFTDFHVGEVNEHESMRVLAVRPGNTMVQTSLPAPNDRFVLREGEDRLFVIDQDVEITASQPVSVLQAISSQQALGIPSAVPGGDPSIMIVPPVDQYRSEYVFLTPQYYAFDFFTVVAESTARIYLDNEPIDPSICTVAAADGRVRTTADPAPTYLVYRCQLSFPDITGNGGRFTIGAGDQGDGYHTLRATSPVSLVMTGFDNYVSYGYVGGMDVRQLVR